MGFIIRFHDPKIGMSGLSTFPAFAFGFNGLVITDGFGFLNSDYLRKKRNDLKYLLV